MNWFCDVSGLNCIDLQRAINDVSLQLNVTLVFLGLLVAFVFVFGVISLWLNQVRLEPLGLERPPFHQLSLLITRLESKS